MIFCFAAIRRICLVYDMATGLYVREVGLGDGLIALGVQACVLDLNSKRQPLFMLCNPRKAGPEASLELGG